jgi:hypothetical protein
MTPTDFEDLLNMMSPIISRKNTTFQQEIPASNKLAVTMRYLATGDSLGSLMYLFRISRASISRLIPEIYDVIITVLHEYVKIWFF